MPSHGNPIEEAFSKVKAFLRRAEARSRGALVEVIGRALSAYPRPTRAGLLRELRLPGISLTAVKGAICLRGREQAIHEQDEMCKRLEALHAMRDGLGGRG